MATQHGLPELLQVFPKDGCAGATTADIIAVHGIETQSPKTWMAYERDEEPRGREVNWLCDDDMLPNLIPQARIWAYNYNSNAFLNDAQEVDILGLGDAFLEIIMAKLTDDRRRQLVFIGSCFGGLVIVQALHKASQGGAKHASLLDSTAGVVFLATPLRGTPLATLAQWVAYLRGIWGKETSSTLLKHLEESGSYLHAIVQGFARIALMKQLPVRCFYETRPTQVSKAFFKNSFLSEVFRETKLVSRESSCLDGHPHIPLDVRHAMMNKFRGPNDGNFKLVSKCVKDLSDNACIIQSRTKEEMNCLRSLTSDYRDNKDRNRKRVPGTCQWVLDHPTFIGWLEAPSGLLWIFADPGCGKSVLSRALVDERRVSRNTKVASICYFFFKDDDAARQSGAHAMSAILHQLFMQRPGLLKHAMPHFEGHGERLHTMLGTLWDILKEAADDPEAGEIVCVLDALDECKELERNQLIEKLGDLVSVPARQTAKLKFLITSRPYLDIESNVRHVVDNMSAISLRGEDESDKISQEISLVIDDRVTCISASRRPPLVKTVQDALKEELNSVPNRSYLWVYLIFDILQRSAESTETRLLKLARTIPRTIDEAYEKILRRVNESGTDEQAKRILHIIVAATRPLTLQEMKIALCIDEKLVEGESCRSFSDLDLPMDEHFREKIRQLCGLFISVIDSIMYLIHQTAKEFLIAKENSEKISRPNEARPQSWKESLQPYESNLLLAEICICYLLFFDINCQVDIDPLLLSSYGSPEYAFLAYAVAYWIDHLRRAKTKRNNNIWKAILDLFSAGSNQRWQLIYWQQAIGLSHIAHVGVTRLTALSTLGLNEAVNLLLDENGAELNALDHDGMTALSWAALKGHTETVQLLLQRDCVEINTRSKALSTPLCQAATEGHGDVVRLLLQKDGLEPDVPDLDSRTPLSWASRNGHTEVVRLLLEKDGVDLNTQDEDGLTPLCLAALAGHADTARLLLQKSGVDPNLPDDAYGLTPLLLAAEEGHAEVVRLLLQRDDVKLKSAGHLCIWTPLIQAILRGRTEVVRLLLDKEGLEPNTMYGQELLSSAARAGHPEIIALLDQAAHQAR